MAIARRIGSSLKRLVTWPWRSLARLTPDGGLFLGLAILCGLLSIGSNSWSNIPLLMCLVLLALWMLAMWQGSLSLKGISFQRSIAEHAFPNEPIGVTLRVTNGSRLPAAGLVISELLEPETAQRSDTRAEDAARQGAAVAQGNTFVMAVAGRGTERAKYTLSVRRRGIYRFGATTVETVFPFGFFHSHTQRRTPGRLVIYPRLGEIAGLFFEDVERAMLQMRRMRPSRAEEDFRGLRDYRREDNPKWIHWKSSARAQKLVVREYEEPKSKRFLLILDTHLLRLGAQRFAAFEQAISFAATAAREMVRRGFEVELVALQPKGSVVRAVSSRDRRNLDQLFEMLAGLRRDDGRTLGQLGEHLPRRTLRSACVLVVGLGSLRTKHNFDWLHTSDNVVRILDARGEEFRHLFQRAPGAGGRDDGTDEDILLSLGDDEDGGEA